MNYFTNTNPNQLSLLLNTAASSLLALGCLAFANDLGYGDTQDVKSAHSSEEYGERRTVFTDPIDSNQTVQALALFKTDYITDAGLNYAPIKIKVNPALKRVLTLFPDDSNSGMTFHYALSDDKKELYYIIAPGTRLQSTGELYYRSFPAGMHNQSDDHYILLRNNNSNAIQYISQSQFCTYTENYELNMKKKDGGVYVSIQNDSDHPYYVYHDGKELNLFFEEYIKGSPLYLYVEHGAMKPQGVSKDYHAACFLFGDDRASFPLNNVNYPNAGLDTPYRSKAMDAGHLCVPHCGTQPRSSCP